MKPVLAAVDQSSHANAVIRRAAELSLLLKSDLFIMSAIGSDPTRMATIAEERDRMTKFHRELIYKHFPGKDVVPESKSPDEIVYRYNPTSMKIRSKILSGNPVDMICRYADEIKADIVILGNRGLGNVGTLVLGSVSERVVRKCSRSVLVVKEDSIENSDWENRSYGENEHRLGAL